MRPEARDAAGKPERLMREAAEFVSEIETKRDQECRAALRIP
jgi:hypothetical protein